MTVMLTLISLLRKVQILLVLLWRLVARCISSSLACRKSATSSSDAKEDRMSTMAFGPGGFHVSGRMNGDVLIDRCTCMLYAYVSGNREVSQYV